MTVEAFVVAAVDAKTACSQDYLICRERSEGSERRVRIARTPP